ncbi:hypothetical protein DSECCO2_65420 [anaerobic digester metagenome]
MKLSNLKLFAAATMAFALFSCGNATENKQEATEQATTEEAAPKEETSCLIGKWTANDAGKTLVFEFKDDNTGTEDIGDGIRNFAWTQSMSNVEIIYANETNKWNLTIDCEKVELSVFGLIYKKK